MHLERVEIVGFRGINRLSLMLEQNNVLIGENAWGKSSLLDALTLLLSPEFELYHFVRDDFWFPPGDVQGELARSGKSRNGRHPFRLYPLCQNDMSRKQNHIPGQLQYSGVFRAFRRFGVLFPAMPNAESRAS